MYNFKLNDNEYTLPNSWEELNFETALKLMKLQENKSLYEHDEFFVIAMIETLLGIEPGDLDDMTIPQLNDISNELLFISDAPKLRFIQHINFNGEDYAFPYDFNAIKVGEYISIKTLQQDKGLLDYLPSVAAILVRKATKSKLEESDKEVWVQSKFTANAIEERIDVLKKMPFIYIMSGLDFFFNGRVD